MPSSAVRTFTDPEDYAAAIRATRAELTVARRGRFAAKLIRIDLHRLWMQRFSDNLPRIAHSASFPGRAIISFRTDPGPSLVWGGAELQPTNILRHHEGGDSFQQSSGSACWGAMSLPVEAMASVGVAVARCRPGAAARCTDSQPLTNRDGEAPAAACGGRESRVEVPQNHRRSRRGARARTGVDRSHGRLSRRRGGSRGQIGSAPARVDHAPISPRAGGISRRRPVSPTNL